MFYKGRNVEKKSKICAVEVECSIKLLKLCDRNLLYPATVQLIIATGWNRKRLFSVNALGRRVLIFIYEY